MKNMLGIYIGLLLSSSALTAADPQSLASTVYEELKKEYLKQPKAESQAVEIKSEHDGALSEMDKLMLGCVEHAQQKGAAMEAQTKWIMERYKEKKDADNTLPDPAYIKIFALTDELESQKRAEQEMFDERNELGKKKADADFLAAYHAAFQADERRMAEMREYVLNCRAVDECCNKK